MKKKDLHSDDELSRLSSIELPSQKQKGLAFLTVAKLKANLQDRKVDMTAVQGKPGLVAALNKEINK